MAIELATRSALHRIAAWVLASAATEHAKQDIASARQLMDAWLPRIDDETARFVVTWRLAQIMMTKAPSEAEQLAIAASRMQISAYFDERIANLIMLAQFASGRGELQDARTFCLDAVALIPRSVAIREYDEIGAHGEASVALALLGDVATATDHLSHAVLFALNAEHRDAHWKHRVVWLSHLATHLQTKIHKWDVDGALLGGLRQGAFYGPTNDALVDRFDPSLEAALCGLVAGLWEMLQNIPRAAEWTDRGLQRSEAARPNMGRGILCWGACAHAAARGTFSEAISLALEASYFVVALKEGDVKLEPRTDVAALVGTMSSVDRGRAEELAADFVWRALGLAIASESTERRRALCDAAVRATEAQAQISRVQETWRGIGRDLHLLSADQAWADLVKTANGAATRGDQRGHLYAGLAVTLASGAPVGICLDVHAAWTTAVERGVHLQEILLVPFLTTYWRIRLATEGFRFRSPRFVVQSFEEAVRRPSPEPARSILDALRSGE